MASCNTDHIDDVIQHGRAGCCIQLPSLTMNSAFTLMASQRWRARLLQQSGFTFLDLGQYIEYKSTLGAAVVPRKQFLTMYHAGRGRPSPSFDAPCSQFFWNRIVHSRMSLRCMLLLGLKSCHACGQRVSLRVHFLTRHCKLCHNTEGTNTGRVEMLRPDSNEFRKLKGSAFQL
jgi:hypothetical protein